MTQNAAIATTEANAIGPTRSPAAINRKTSIVATMPTAAATTRRAMMTGFLFFEGRAATLLSPCGSGDANTFGSGVSSGGTRKASRRSAAIIGDSKTQ